MDDQYIREEKKNVVRLYRFTDTYMVSATNGVWWRTTKQTDAALGVDGDRGCLLL
jgi:hypothetical protein